MSRPRGYSATQIGLHWAVAALVLFQLLGSEGMENAWRASARGADASAGDARFATFHAISGILILLLMIARLVLRLTRGTPPPPPQEPRFGRILSRATHDLIYLVLILMPLGGAAAWFGGVAIAAEAHELMKYPLIGLIALHFAGVLAQYFVFRTDVPARMMIADDGR